MIYLIEMVGDDVGDFGEDGYFVDLSDQELADVKKVLEKAVSDGHLREYNISDLSDRTNSKSEFLEVLDANWGLCEGHEKSSR